MSYYDKSGNPITFFETVKLKGDLKYLRVRETTLEDGKWVSTVWLGLDHSWNGGRPIIFETMVFKNSGAVGDLECWRYSTEEEAIKGHEELVQKYMALLHVEQLAEEQRRKARS